MQIQKKKKEEFKPNLQNPIRDTITNNPSNYIIQQDIINSKILEKKTH